MVLRVQCNNPTNQLDKISQYAVSVTCGQKSLAHVFLSISANYYPLITTPAKTFRGYCHTVYAICIS
ncbi:hypothetical protein BRADI_4g04835v3 [Brachypodium distachyon]|uniref:Uncharacterized protein n=1 Tax=Brachypodium distachyon TaxID=15368 RepID=A0A2K2CKH4_BRADI|nr:hypothetical protein BRADI_4g04835v3 [Brachypodium distachyon]